MIERIRERIVAFINSPKDVPVLAGFSVGLYMLLFYYSKNFGIANSLQQIAFFVAYYMLLPIVVLSAGYKLLGLTKFSVYNRNFLFVGMLAFLAFYIIQINRIWISKKLEFAVVLIVLIVLSIWIKKYYKLAILMLFLMSLFNVKPLAHVAWVALKSSSEWKQQPDDITQIVFKKRPNIYYIQPDGYVNSKNLKKPPYNYDNSAFEEFLTSEGFTIYPDFRSNYFSTLLSNSSFFSMKHHYSANDVNLYGARNIIVNDNAVLDILKKNNYKTHFLTERPYLVVNRPKMGYDYSNIEYSHLPYLRDGWLLEQPLFEDLKKLNIKASTGNFYFIEKLSPNHIETYSANATDIEKERKKYLQRLEETNKWLTDVIAYISEKDPDGLIVVGADHGGYVGFSYALQALKKIEDPVLAESIFGAHLSIKWNDTAFKEYDKDLKSSVNLFRVIFAYLAEDKKYLQHLQKNDSYLRLSEPKGVYRYINDKGQVVLEKANDIQD